MGSGRWVCPTHTHKSRPEIACMVAIGASVQRKQPKEPQRSLIGCWTLLPKTIMLGMCMEAIPGHDL
eukprot:12886807-Prorocentrum_lima.AAC.1